MIFFYRLLFIIIVVLGAPFLLIKALAGHHGIKERLGFVEARKSSPGLFWFHAASVGEMKILSLVIPKIKKVNPDLPIAISTTTITGRSVAGKLFGDNIQVFLQPLELKSAVKRTISRIKPERLIVVETELWPLMLRTASGEGASLFLINGRISAKSFRLYKLFRPLFSSVLKRFEKIMVQTAEDAERFKKLGAINISIVGNVKYDQVLAEKDIKSYNIDFTKYDNFKFVAGSIRRGEDVIFADLVHKSVERNLPYQFILAPRHMKDVNALCGVLKEKSLEYLLWSEYNGRAINEKEVLIVNTMGELLGFYNMADIAFVGGSLVPIGGHDPVEPASLGKMVLFGPHMDNAAEAARTLLDSGGAHEVRSSDDILSFMAIVCEKREVLKENGNKCRNAVKSLSGASEKTVELLMREKT